MLSLKVLIHRSVHTTLRANSHVEIDREHWVVGYSQEEIDEQLMGGTAADFHKQHSIKNGLIQDMLDSKATKEEFQEGLLALVKKHCPQSKTCPLVTIH